jgi:hypothetical protein
MTRDVVQNIDSMLAIADRDAFGAFPPNSFARFQFEGISHGSAVGVQVLFDLLGGEELRPSEPLSWTQVFELRQYVQVRGIQAGHQYDNSISHQTLDDATQRNFA